MGASLAGRADLAREETLVFGFGIHRESGRVPNADRFEWRRLAALVPRDVSWIVQAVAYEQRSAFLERN
jgi:hypothetical protein